MLIMMVMHRYSRYWCIFIQCLSPEVCLWIHSLAAVGLSFWRSFSTSCFSHFLPWAVSWIMHRSLWCFASIRWWFTGDWWLAAFVAGWAAWLSLGFGRIGCCSGRWIGSWMIRRVPQSVEPGRWALGFSQRLK